MTRQQQKTFLTMFIFLTAFLVAILLLFNIFSYQREKNFITENLDFSKENNDYKNIQFIDIDVYTVEIDNNNEIVKIYNHGIEDSKFNVEKIAKEVLKKNNLNKSVIGNLYFKKYSYSFRYKHSITIINNKEISKRLRKILFVSFILFILGEIAFYFASKNLTKSLVKPVKEVNKDKNLLVEASHELKEPLDIIISSSNELIKDNKNKKQINTIQFEAERMNRLLNKFLEISKLDNHLPAESIKIENLSSIVENSCMNFEPNASEKQIKIVKRIEPNVMLKCSRPEIDKVLSILIDNAIKHCPKKTTITVDLFKNKNDITIRVSNPGSPIKPGEEDKIFETFYRSKESKDRSNNRYGMKMVIAKNIVNKHNGTINAYSENGLTAFKIVFKR
mgnify:CR=1 FL=1